MTDAEATRQHALLNILAGHCGEMLTPDKVEQIAGELYAETTEGATAWAFGYLVVKTAGIDIDPGLLAALKPGASLRRTIGSATPTPHTELWHVWAIVDGERVVYRVWSRSRRRWVYQIDNIFFLHLCWQTGTLETA